MPVLMPTARLWAQLGAPYPLRPLAPSTDSVLGDWVLKPAAVQRRRFIVGVNERTLMAVVFATRPLAKLASTPAVCVGAQLEVFGVPEARILAELAALESVTIAKTRDRSLLGILNEVAFMFEAYAEGSKLASASELLEIQTKLNQMPHRAGSPSHLFARDAIEAILGDKTLH